MRRTGHHKGIRTASALCAALLLVAASCGDDDNDAVAEVDSQSGPTDDGEGDGEGTEGTADDGAGQEGGGESQSGGDLTQDLDISVRNDDGVTLTLSQLSIEDGDIYIDMEVANGSTSRQTWIAMATTSDDIALRVVDVAGYTYPLVEEGLPDRLIRLNEGDSVDGTYAFRGPLAGQPQRLVVVANMETPESIEGAEIGHRATPGNPMPGFIVPIDLEWS